MVKITVFADRKNGCGKFFVVFRGKCYMNHFETTAKQQMNVFRHLWFHYVDDVFAMQENPL